ncbi:hypothetical protein Q1695_000947 [Nippostrongylus brasiliensis]|nr:hypothetical protein Q1695_000947 [Nippostrongylus brasiliensis]
MNQCCGPWTARGECQRNPGVMRVVCPASCGWCSPAYNLGDNCANRSQMCKIFVLAGECSKNYQWMAENCRKECAFCANTREQMCPDTTMSDAANDSPSSNSLGSCSTLPALIERCRTPPPQQETPVETYP